MNNTNPRYLLKLFCMFAAITLLHSCLIVRSEKESGSSGEAYKLAPKPEIPMSDEIVRSNHGDMIAFLPSGWFFVDVEDKAASDIIAVAVNPDYTLSAVFSVIRNTEREEESVKSEGLLGIARMCLEKHRLKTAGGIRQTGDFSELQIGTEQFVKFEFSAGNDNFRTQAVVYRSESGQYYQFALVPLNFSGKEAPNQADIDKIFRSILATIQY